jgi:hypothetical protein
MLPPRHLGVQFMSRPSVAAIGTARYLEDDPLSTLASILLLPLCLSGTTLSTSERDALREFQAWLGGYRAGREADAAANQNLEALFYSVGQCKGEATAATLMDAATFYFSIDPAVEKSRAAAFQPWIVRERAVQTLSRLEDDAARAYLRRTLLLDKASAASDLRRAVAGRALGLNPLPVDLYYLQRGLLDRAPDARLACVQGLKTAGKESCLAPLAGLFHDPDEGIRVAVVTAVAQILARLGPNEPPEVHETALDHVRGALEDSSWRVQLVAVECLRQVRAKGNVPALIAALTAQAGGDPPRGRERVRIAVHRALIDLTGHLAPANRPSDWSDWWAQAAEKFQLAEPEKAKTYQTPKYPHLFDIPLNSDRIAFVLDISGSMNDSLPTLETNRPHTATLPSKWERLIEEMRGALDAMQPNVKFNIFVFNERVRGFSRELETAIPENKTSALQWLKGIHPKGGTNLFGGLERALGIGDISSLGRYFNTGADTIVLLSDGQPTVGAVVNPDQIIELISNANELSRVQIHTISLGDSPLLRELARRNEGEHRAINSW